MEFFYILGIQTWLFLRTGNAEKSKSKEESKWWYKKYYRGKEEIGGAEQKKHV